MELFSIRIQRTFQLVSTVRYYTNRNIGISYLRAKKKNDTQRVLDLYGTDNQKYW